MRTVSRLAITLAASAVLAAACTNDESRGGSEQVSGVTDTEVKFGTHLPLSQSPAAAYAPLGDGMRAYFAFINETEGGVHGRQITLIEGDDHYNPSDTIEVVRKLVEQDGVFAIVGGLGEETHLAAWKYLEERGIPDLFISSGISRWTDPTVLTRFGGNPVYMQEGQMLGQYVAAHYDGKKLGLLIQNNLLGCVAYRANKKLEWDPEALKAKNCPEADPFIKRPYREGWSL